MLTLYRPFSSLFRDDFADRDWNSLFFGGPLANRAAATFTPAVDVLEQENAYVVRAEIPGKFSALPAKASAMYAPELRGNSDELKVKIED